MDKLCKSTLSQWLSDSANKERDLDKMKSWFKQLLSAVAYIHNQGMIHRDLKVRDLKLSIGVNRRFSPVTFFSDPKIN